MTGTKLPRFVLASFPDSYTLPARPAKASAAVLDAHRQAGFLLGEELALFERAMNLQLRVVVASAKVKGAPAFALLSSWSRTFSLLADACAVMTSGSYGSCPPLLRTALDCLAAQRSFLRDGFGEFEAWHAGAVSQEAAALVIDVGRFRAGSVLAEDESLGLLYRLLSDLSMPHLGGTLFLVAPESSLQKLPLGFADSAFHLGWAELITGWLLRLAILQIETAIGAGVFTMDDALAAECADARTACLKAVHNPKRCHVEDAGGRFVFQNFRRAPTGQPKRVILG